MEMRSSSRLFIFLLMLLLSITALVSSLVNISDSWGFLSFLVRYTKSMALICDRDSSPRMSVQRVQRTLPPNLSIPWIAE